MHVSPAPDKTINMLEAICKPAAVKQPNRLIRFTIQCSRYGVKCRRSAASGEGLLNCAIYHQ